MLLLGLCLLCAAVAQEGPAGVKDARRLDKHERIRLTPMVEDHQRGSSADQAETAAVAPTLLSHERPELAPAAHEPAPAHVNPVTLDKPAGNALFAEEVLEPSNELEETLKQNTVDFVVPWTDYDDPATIDTILQSHINPDAVPRPSEPLGGPEMLRFALRSYAKNAPFVRRIHLLVPDAQPVPAWLAQEDHRVHVVRHKSIFERATDLPSFNPAAVEANLHRIQGMSERFCLLQPSMLLTSPVSRSDLFSTDGKPKTFYESAGTDTPSPDNDTPPEVRNSNDLLVAALGADALKPPSRSAMHKHRLNHLVPMLKSSMAAPASRFATELARTSHHRTPDPSDVSLVQLATLLALDSGDYIATHWHESEVAEIKLDGSSEMTAALSTVKSEYTSPKLTRLYAPPAEPTAPADDAHAHAEHPVEDAELKPGATFASPESSLSLSAVAASSSDAVPAVAPSSTAGDVSAVLGEMFPMKSRFEV